MKLRALAALLFLAFALNITNARPDSDRSASVSFNRKASSDAALQWADSVMATLSERQRVAQLFVPHLVIKDDAPGRALLTRLVKTDGVGGILLGKGTIDSYVSLINLAQREAKVPLLVTLDGEWGPAMRLTDAPRFPYNMSLGAVRDSRLLYDYGREVARQCSALGINVDFAPVADVNSNPENPVIGYRSFGENPSRVAEAVVAFGKGMEDGGVISVAKHFPGHGDTSTDSHKTLPLVGHSAEKMDETDLVPFRKYIDAGLSGIMVGHLKVPSLDRSGAPASLSNRITSGLLKDRMGFDGLVFTDALAMRGADSRENSCIAALKAGADMLLGSASPSKDIDAVVAAVKRGEISRRLVDERCRKVLAYKYALGLDRRPTPASVEEARKIIRGESGANVRRRLAAGAVTAVQDNASLLPLHKDKGKKIAVVSIGAPLHNQFADRCTDLGQVDLFNVTDGSGLTQAQLTRLKSYDIVVAPVFSNSASSQTAFGKLSVHGGLVGVFFMNPYKMAKFGGALRDIPALLLAGDDTPELRTAAADGLFGLTDIDGRLPVTLPNIAAEGSGKTVRPAASEKSEVRLTLEIDSIMQQSLDAKAFPGAQVLVMKDGEIVHYGNYGFTDYGKRHRVNDSTLYDLASVTKATATLSGLMKAYDEGLFSLDDPVSKFVPGLQTADKRKITFRQMLLHESGFPASIGVQKLFMEGPKNNRKLRSDLVSRRQSDDFDLEMADGLYVGVGSLDTLMQRIYDVKLKPATYRYSDLNFCLLREALENMTGVSLDQWLETEVLIPAGIPGLMFNPLETRRNADNIAPTERDTDFRNQLVHGHVHDETAAVSGGVQGNAGLFGSAKQLGRLCQMFLDNGKSDGRQIIDKRTVKEFTTTSNKRGNRFLGFDRQPEDSPAPPATYGHNGFTGTCFWVDPVNKIVIVFLSNRVHPSRNNSAFTRLKPRTAVIESVYRNL